MGGGGGGGGGGGREGVGAWVKGGTRWSWGGERVHGLRGVPGYMDYREHQLGRAGGGVHGLRGASAR